MSKTLYKMTDKELRGELQRLRESYERTMMGLIDKPKRDAIHQCAQKDAEIAKLKERQEAHLRLIKRISTEAIDQDEADELGKQIAALIAEVGTLRGHIRELLQILEGIAAETLRADLQAKLDELHATFAGRKSVAPYSKTERTSAIRVVDQDGNPIENAVVRLYRLVRPFELGDSEEDTVTHDGVKWKVEWQ